MENNDDINLDNEINFDYTLEYYNYIVGINVLDNNYNNVQILNRINRISINMDDGNFINLSRKIVNDDKLCKEFINYMNLNNTINLNNDRNNIGNLFNILDKESIDNDNISLIKDDIFSLSDILTQIKNVLKEIEEHIKFFSSKQVLISNNYALKDKFERFIEKVKKRDIYLNNLVNDIKEINVKLKSNLNENNESYI